MSLKQAKTYSPKLAEIQHDWYIVDAAERPLGRVAGEIALLLMGKHKPQFSHHLNMGDNVVVINAAKISVSGNKLEDKKYYRHSGYPGGIRETSLGELLEKHPERAIVKAVEGMLPKNKLAAERMIRLKVYVGAEHPHAPQKPKAWKGAS